MSYDLVPSTFLPPCIASRCKSTIINLSTPKTQSARSKRALLMPGAKRWEGVSCRLHGSANYIHPPRALAYVWPGSCALCDRLHLRPNNRKIYVFSSSAEPDERSGRHWIPFPVGPFVRLRDALTAFFFFALGSEPEVSHFVLRGVRAAYSRER